MCFHLWAQPTESAESSACGVLSSMEAVCVVCSEFYSSRQLSDDVCVAHQLGEHMAVPADIREKQIPLWRRGGIAASAASSSGQTEQALKQRPPEEDVDPGVEDGVN